MSCMLRAMREFRGLTQQELADITGISRRTIAGLERHDRGASSRMQAMLAEGLGLSPQLRMVLFGKGGKDEADRDR